MPTVYPTGPSELPSPSSGALCTPTEDLEVDCCTSRMNQRHCDVWDQFNSIQLHIYIALYVENESEAL